MTDTEWAYVEASRRLDQDSARACGVPATYFGVDVASGPDRTVYHWRSGSAEKTTYFRGGHRGGGKSDELRGASPAFIIFDDAPPPAIDLEPVDGVWRVP